MQYYMVNEQVHYDYDWDLVCRYARSFGWSRLDLLEEPSNICHYQFDYVNGCMNSSCNYYHFPTWFRDFLEPVCRVRPDTFQKEKMVLS